MPRSARRSAGGVVYHVLNRGNGRQRLFHKPGDYGAFVELLADVKASAAVHRPLGAWHTQARLYSHGKEFQTVPWPMAA